MSLNKFAIESLKKEEYSIRLTIKKLIYSEHMSMQCSMEASSYILPQISVECSSQIESDNIINAYFESMHINLRLYFIFKLLKAGLF